MPMCMNGMEKGASNELACWYLYVYICLNAWIECIIGFPGMNAGMNKWTVRKN
jgi:hypothetical protein